MKITHYQMPHVLLYIFSYLYTRFLFTYSPKYLSKKYVFEANRKEL